MPDRKTDFKKFLLLFLLPDHFHRSRGGLTYRSLSAITRDKVCSGFVIKVFPVSLLVELFGLIKVLDF